MTAPQPDTALAPARQRLNDAIRNLIDPRSYTLPEGRFTYLDSIYQELSESVYEKHALGGGRAQPASPLWIAASDCLSDIDRAVRAEHPDKIAFAAENRSQRHPGHQTVLRLQAIDARTWRPEDTEHITRFANDLERLTVCAATLLTPPRRFYLPDACPYCNLDHVEADDNGENVQRPALEIVMTSEGKNYCHCGNPECDGWWDNFPRLGLLLGYDPLEGVIW